MELNVEQNIAAQIDFSVQLTEQQAKQIYQQGEAAVVFVLLAL